VPPIGPFRRSLAATPPARGVPGVEGRTLAAVLATLREAEATWLVARAAPRRAGGLLDGVIDVPSAGALRMNSYTDVAGVTLDGTLVVKLNADGKPLFPLTLTRGTIRIRGNGAHGTLRIAGGKITGRLGARA